MLEAVDLPHEFRPIVESQPNDLVSIHVPRAAAILLCTLTELQAHFRFKGARINERLHQIWSALLVVPDVLAGGHSVTSTRIFDNALIRLNTDGSLDSTFGSGGIVLNKLPSNAEGYFRVFIQSDGKIVAAGITTGITCPTTFNTVNNLTLSRYLAQ